jgi:hypothetical protein
MYRCLTSVHSRISSRGLLSSQNSLRIAETSAPSSAHRAPGQPKAKIVLNVSSPWAPLRRYSSIVACNMNWPAKSNHSDDGIQSSSSSCTLAAVSSIKSGSKQCNEGVPARSVTHLRCSRGIFSSEASWSLFSKSASSDNGKSFAASNGCCKAHMQSVCLPLTFACPSLVMLQTVREDEQELKQSRSESCCWTQSASVVFI